MTAKEPSSNTSRVIIVIASILVVTALGFFAYNFFSQKEVNRKTLQEKDLLSSEILDLEKQILQFKIENDSQESALMAKDGELAQARKQIDRFESKLAELKREAKDTNQELDLLKKRLSNMLTMISQYEDQIEQLKAEKLALVQDLDSVTTDLEAANEDYSKLEKNRNDVANELDKTKKLGSILRTDNITYYKINEKGNPTNDKGKKSFRRITFKTVRVCFDVLDNLVTDPGQKEIYLVLESPDGTINTNMKDGFSGTFKYQGGKKEYSSRLTFNYNKTTVNVCIDYSIPEGQKFQKGPQFVRIYSGDDNLIGTGQFEVK
ncbi:MAG: hypothetical protein MRZ79_26450 [Bacteroidia bacterium]|nr:hypothetical protein [Bacteroidia bacterium]